MTDRLTYSAFEAAEVLGVSYRTVYRMMADPNPETALPKVKVNGRWRIPVAALEAWVERNTIVGTAA